MDRFVVRTKRLVQKESDEESVIEPKTKINKRPSPPSVRESNICHDEDDHPAEAAARSSAASISDETESDEESQLKLRHVPVQPAFLMKQENLSCWPTTGGWPRIGDLTLEAITQIKDRFCFTDPVFTDASFLIPGNARALKPPSLVAVGRKYGGSVVSDVSKLDSEWRRHILIKDNNDDDTLKYWKKISLQKNDMGDSRFPNLNQLVSHFFSLPFSNAAVERIFSHLNNIKTEHRNRLAEETTAALLCLKQGLRRTGMKAESVLSSKETNVLPSLNFKSWVSSADRKKLRLENLNYE